MENNRAYRYSRLWLNRYLSEQSQWTRPEIEKRAALIYERFLKIWYMPNIQIEEAEESDEVNIFDAEEPTHRKLEYAILLDQKIEVTEVAKLYVEVIKKLFDLQPHTFFTTDLGEQLNISDHSSNCRQAAAINETYFIESNIDNKGKFERMKKALTACGLEDDLSIKYKS